MNYNTLKLIKQHIKNFTYVNPCPTESRTFKWTDYWFGVEGDGIPVTQEMIDEGEAPQIIDINDLHRGKTILTLSFFQTSKSLVDSGLGTTTSKYTFSYIKGIGFINSFTKNTLQKILHLSDYETSNINLIFEEDLKTFHNTVLADS